jgi:hypothetical protein
MNKESIAKGIETRRKNREAKIAVEQAQIAQRVAAKTKFITDFLSSDSLWQKMKLGELYDTIEKLTQKLQQVEFELERYREDHPDTTYDYDS